jgi:hypothetical protein
VASFIPSPHIGTVPLLLDELDELLDDELLDDEVDDELLDDELDSPLDEEALDALLDDDDVLQSVGSPKLINPSVSSAHACTRTPSAKVIETMVQIAKVGEWWRIGSKCAVYDGASSVKNELAGNRDGSFEPCTIITKNFGTKALGYAAYRHRVAELESAQLAGHDADGAAKWPRPTNVRAGWSVEAGS